MKIISKSLVLCNNREIYCSKKIMIFIPKTIMGMLAAWPYHKTLAGTNPGVVMAKTVAP